MEELLNQGERIDDLQYKGFKIIQNPEEFCFGIDAVLLSDFAQIKQHDLVLDLGTGTGIIPILIAAKTQAKHITGVEIQSNLSNMAQRSVKLNNIEDKVSIINEDLRKAKDFLTLSSYDIITCNPPYKNEKTGLINSNNSKAIAKHEIKCTLEDIVEVSSRVLKVGGKFYMIHRPARLPDIFCIMRKHKLEPKKSRFVYSKKHKPPPMILIEGVRNGGSDFKVEKPLFIYENNEYSKEIKEIYYGGN